ncbi:hypothetical protein F4780DRAFT_743050 [Xylariomycetidae sp. FL0641]|nr:hypothetical protein F4780DRAFT_743050 [Xylariomycetidae sp. FL0641]
MDSPFSKPNPSRAARFDRIDIWRNEVSSSRIYCVCSAPAILAEDAASLSGSSTALSSSSGNPVEPTVRPIDRIHALPRFLARQSRSRLVLEEKKSSEGEADCPVCASPTDGVSYVSFSKDGSGLVRLAAASRSEDALRKFEEDGPAKSKQAKRRLLKTMSMIFKGPRPFDLSTSIRKSPLSGKGAIIDKKTGPTSQGENIRMATEMYQALRPRDRANEIGASDQGSVETLGVMSDDERKKPQLTVDASAARLRRAQKLLDKTLRRNQ